MFQFNSLIQSTGASFQVVADESSCLSQGTQSFEKLPEEPCTTGIKNLGYTCFLSSVVQCLAHCRELRDYILRNVVAALLFGSVQGVMSF